MWARPSLERPVLPSSPPTMAGGGRYRRVAGRPDRGAGDGVSRRDAEPEPQPALISLDGSTTCRRRASVRRARATVSKSDDVDPRCRRKRRLRTPEAAACRPPSEASGFEARSPKAGPQPPAHRVHPTVLETTVRSVRIEVSGDASRVKLQGDAGAFVVPGNVVPGTYTIWAAFPGEESAQRGTVTVEDGGVVRVNCDSMFRTCVKR